MSPLAFAAPVLPTRALRSSATSTSPLTPRCSLPQVDANYPRSTRNAAPHITFDGENGIKFSMARVAAYTEVDAAEGPLLDYTDSTDWVAAKPAANAVAWPAQGDGRDVKLDGNKGFFTVGDDKEYKEFPQGGFFKRSMDG